MRASNAKAASGSKRKPEASDEPSAPLARAMRASGVASTFWTAWLGGVGVGDGSEAQADSSVAANDSSNAPAARRKAAATTQ